jgi:hypothetical protein
LLRGASDGSPLFRVTARDRDQLGKPDSVLSSLDRSGTTSYGSSQSIRVLHEADSAGILRFRARGGGLLIARDHMDLSCSICALGSIGAANVFHSHNAISPPPEDDGTPDILWPNIHPDRIGISSECRQSRRYTRHA